MLYACPIVSRLPSPGLFVSVLVVWNFLLPLIDSGGYQKGANTKITLKKEVND